MTPADFPVAIVGLAGAMPGSHDLAEYWHHLLAGHDLVTEVPAERWDWREFFGDPLAADSNRTASRWGGFTPLVDGFDAAFFGIAPREAATMDPQQRLMLTAAWEAIENAGMAPAALAGRRVGVFVGASGSDFKSALEQPEHVREPHQASGTHQTMVANRISYFFDLRGPSETLDTACSSSLVAIHRAIAALRSGEVELCLAGAVNLLLNPEMTIQYAKAGMLSPDGRCQTFDASANGYVRSEGYGCVLLKPLAQALADGDVIHAVIRGSAENHGGRANSLTAPNPRAQTALIVDALARAGVPAASVSYVEAHGTGTALGDPIEINALKAAWRQLGVGAEARCALGAVKSNVGHLEAAAGMAGLFKLVFAMQQARLPGSLHHRKTNPHIDFAGSPFHLLDATSDWIAPEDANGMRLPLRAGISSFGFGGVNAHLIVEQAPPPPDGHDDSAAPALILLSAPDAERLRESVAQLLDWLAPGHDALHAGSARVLDLLLGEQARLAGQPVAALDPARSFGELGISPARMARLLTVVGAGLGVALELADLGRSTSPAEAAEAIARKLASHHATPRADTALVRRLPRLTRLHDGAALHDIAYTLQTGRQVFDERLAIIASTREELIAALAARLAATTPGASVGDDSRNAAIWTMAHNPRRAAAAITTASDAPPLQALALRWLNEKRPRIDWQAQHATAPRRRLPLPGTPLRLLTIPRTALPGHLRRPPVRANAADVLLGHNVCGLDQLGFDLVLAAGTAPWHAGADRAADATLAARRGLALLAAALTASRRLGAATAFEARDAVWAAPADLPVGARLLTRLAGTRTAAVTEVALEHGARTTVLFQADVDFAAPAVASAAASADARDPATIDRLAASGRALASPPNTGIDWIRADDSSLALAFAAPAGADANDGAALPIAALHAALAALGAGNAQPFRLDRLWLASADAAASATDSAPGWLLLQRHPGAALRFDLRLLDRQRRLIARLDGLELRQPAGAQRGAPADPARATTRVCVLDWIDAVAPAVMPASGTAPATAAPLLALDRDGWLARALAPLAAPRGVLPLTPAAQFARRADGACTLRPDHADDWAQLLDSLPPEAELQIVADAEVSAGADACVDADPVAASLALFGWIQALARAVQSRPDRVGVDLLLALRRDAVGLAPALHALALSLNAEPGRLRLRLLDTDAASGADLPPADLLAELACSNGPASADSPAAATDGPLARQTPANAARHPTVERPPVERVRYRDGRRQTPVWTALPHRATPAFPIRPGAVVLITGGLGGLGRLFARHLGLTHGCVIESCGRSPASAADLQAFADAGIRLRHHALDVGDAAAVATLVQDIVRRHGRLDGVLHAAGTLRDDLFPRKTADAVRQVLAPKLAGTLALDHATAGLDLGFFALFGSVVGVFGNPGQTDYAFANGWLDGFAHWRAAEVAAGRRRGQSLALDWPYWADGGMAMSELQQALFLQRHGLLALPSDAGLAAFDAALAAGRPQALVLHGPAADRIAPAPSLPLAEATP